MKKNEDFEKQAIEYIDSNLRILSGPGTGKTRVLTEKFIYLIKEKNVDPSEIVALTFTRASANELKSRVLEKNPGMEGKLRISTLHSFCLRQLLRNSKTITSIFRNFRIADDWEERNIIHEDIKKIINAKSVKQVQEQFDLLSADYQSLSDEPRDPKFIGAWHEHNQIYGYILRDEIVYQLKKALEQYDCIDLEGPIKYLLVDEFQDLNHCDQAIVREIYKMGAVLFIGGDDDQSIYGFRKAYPFGIRNFLEDYPNSRSIELEICYRCDREIINISQFVADLDTERPKKNIRPRENCKDGIVEIIKNTNENDEAISISLLCDRLIRKSGYDPDDILILIRSNKNYAYSSLFSKAFENHNIPFTDKSTSLPIINSKEGRLYYSFFRLIVDKNDNLAWRTLLKLSNNQIGDKKIDFLYETAKENTKSFSEIIELIHNDELKIDNEYITCIENEIEKIYALISKYIEPNNEDKTIDIDKKIKDIFIDINNYGIIYSKVEEYFLSLSHKEKIKNLFSYVELFSDRDDEIEQVIEKGKVNLLTMHQAKGLTAKIVIIPVAEDEVIPGRNDDFQKLGDERRLFYVSLSRACHRLYISYCNRRVTSAQKYLGKNSGSPVRSLTRFLRDYSLTPKCADEIFNNFK